MKKFSYHTENYNLKEMVRDLFGVSDLRYLHKEREDLCPRTTLNFDNESKTKFHDLFYSRLKSGWPEIYSAYYSFLENEIKPILDGDFIFQSFPTVRFHLPYDQAIHYWHYDTDSDHSHPDWEINFHLCLTDICQESQAVWVESVPGLADYSPMMMNYGEYYVFNGGKCRHGNMVNLSDETRVSFDFRIMPTERYDQLIGSTFSATKKKRFIVGDYYDRFK